MEIIGENKTSAVIKKKNTASSIRSYIGAVHIGFGTVLLLSNNDVLTPVQEKYIFSWQMVVILFGGLVMTAKKHGLGTVFL